MVKTDSLISTRIPKSVAVGKDAIPSDPSGRGKPRRSVVPEGLRLHVGPEPAGLGALAFTYGRDIYLAPETLELPTRVLGRVLAHELCHVFQQLEGRVRPDASIRGVPICRDAGLEAEADLFWRRPASGGVPAPPRARSRGARPVVQRLVRIAGEPLQEVGRLGEKGSLALRLIDFGAEWAEWAVASPQRVFDFPDLPGLLEGIQRGLHQSPLILVSRLGLKVAVPRLLELSSADLRLLVTFAEDTEGEADQEVQVRKMLARNGLHGLDALRVARDQLGLLGVGDAAVFHVGVTLADQVALFTLFDSAEGETRLSRAYQKEAASFAVTRARNPIEFVDYYGFYMDFLERIAKVGEPGKQGKAAARIAQAAAVVEELQRFAWSGLVCPVIPGSPSPAELTAVVGQLIGAGQDVGFGRMSALLQQLMAHSSYRGEVGEAAGAAVAGYWRDLRDFLRNHEARSVTLSQDGDQRRYRYESKDLTALLELDARNVLAVVEFGRR